MGKLAQCIKRHRSTIWALHSKVEALACCKALCPACYQMEIPTHYHGRPVCLGATFTGPHTLLLTTQWGAVTSIVAIDTEQAGNAAKAPVALTPVDTSAPGAASWSLLGVSGGMAVAARAAPDSPTDIYVAQLPVSASMSRSCQSYSRLPVMPVL